MVVFAGWHRTNLLRRRKSRGTLVKNRSSSAWKRSELSKCGRRYSHRIRPRMYQESGHSLNTHLNHVGQLPLHLKFCLETRYSPSTIVDRMKWSLHNGQDISQMFLCCTMKERRTNRWSSHSFSKGLQAGMTHWLHFLSDFPEDVSILRYVK